MRAPSQSTVLTIGVATPLRSSSALDLYAASTVREALATLRLVSFDLVLAGLDDPSIDVWTVMQRILAAWPQQRWILAASDLTPEEEILARSLGALIVLNAVPDEMWLAECAESLQQRRLQRTPPPLVGATAGFNGTALSNFRLH